MSKKKNESEESEQNEASAVTEEGDELQKQVTSLEEEVAELKDKYLRLFAEFDNYKKRTARERLDLIRTATEDLIVRLLPVLDDFERAKKTAESPDSEEVFSEGVQLVYHKLHQILESKGLKPMDLVTKEFDPELHEAITKIPVSDQEAKGRIIDCVEKGYYLQDKIIRYAKVVIGE